MNSYLFKILNGKKDKLKKIERLVRIETRFYVESRFSKDDYIRKEMRKFSEQTKNNLEKLKGETGLEESVLNTIINKDNLLILEYTNMLNETLNPEERRTCDNCRYFYEDMDCRKIKLEDEIYCGRHPKLDPTSSEGARIILYCRKTKFVPINKRSADYSKEKQAYLENKLKELIAKRGYIKKEK